MFDRFELFRSAGIVQFELLPPSNSRHEFNTEQERERKYVGRLAMRVGVNSSGSQVGQSILQNIENVGCFVNAAADESTEQRDVVVRDAAIRDSSGLSVPKVTRRE
jgi:hypothetical protein